MYDVSFFKDELALIEDPVLRFVVKNALEAAPKYFWTAPASSSGKYHPPDSNGVGGLVRHTVKGIWIVYKLAECFGADSDMMTSAMHLHDWRKFGKDDVMETGRDRPQYKHHAELAAEALQKRFPEFSKDADKLHFDALENKWYGMCSCIRSHMGKWGTCPPFTLEQRLVHIADVISAHKELVAVKFYDPDRPVDKSSERPPGVTSEDSNGKQYFSDSGGVMVLNFGKHFGRSVEEMVHSFPDYIRWVLEEDFSEDVKDVFREAQKGSGDFRVGESEKKSGGTMPSFEGVK